MLTMVLVLVTAMILLLTILSAVMFRVVVPSNYVHIVQYANKRSSFGNDLQAGNVYYRWPSWVPRFGVKVIELPVSVFDVQLNNYAAYDKGRVPFVVDILAFFRIEDSNIAAQRVSSFSELQNQLSGILQGASRSILAQSPIEEILEERAKYGELFTAATNDQLKAWGVTNVKNVELMDIRDANNSKVINNIMAIKQSLIEKDSRTNVAKNIQEAQTAEILASQTVAIKQQEAEQLVGVRTAQKTQEVGISNQQATQAIKEQEKLTAEKQMLVVQVQQVRQAEINREVQVVQADQQKQVAVINADAEKQKTITVAQGNLEQSKMDAQGKEAIGKAEGTAQQAILMAPVNAQINLAKEIGQNGEYQKYLVAIKTIDANQAVGIEQAKALTAADIKVITTIGAPQEALKGVMDVFSAKGGAQIGAAIEAIANTPTGKAITEKLGLTGGESA